MLKTEQRNPKTMNIDKMDTVSMLNIINEENMVAVKAVGNQTANIAKAVDAVAAALADGGRLFYVGAGTSGRLGVADAAECPPTFGVDSGMIVGIIAGGATSMVKASEGQEDDANAGMNDLKAYNLCKKDVVMGISAAGGAAYVVSAIKYAKSLGCVTVGLTSNEGSPVDKESDISICTDTGAEVVTGSTRMKAGTAQKLVLNMISTGAMIKNGYVYENMMINLKPSNIKLRKRMIGIVCEIKKCDEAEAEKLLEMADWSIRKAVEL